MWKRSLTGEAIGGAGGCSAVRSLPALDGWTVSPGEIVRHALTPSTRSPHHSPEESQVATEAPAPA